MYIGPQTETPVKDGRIHNGPKVAKCLGGQIPPCTNGVTTRALSQRSARRNCNAREHADDPRGDKETPGPSLQPGIGLLASGEA